MSTTTTNYGLIKPDTTDPILIGQLNDNADAIDAALKENADAIENKPDAADIPTPSTAAPAMDGTAAAGTSTDYARADHVHPSDTSKQDALTAAQLAAVNSGINSAKVEQIETNKNNILLKANADNTAYKTAAASFSGTNMQCVFDSAMFTADNRRGSVLMMFGSQKSSVNNTLLMIDFNDAGIRSIRRLTDDASEVITAIGAISSDKQSFAFTADGNSYTYPCLISMFANKDIKPNFTIVAQT